MKDKQHPLQKRTLAKRAQLETRMSTRQMPVPSTRRTAQRAEWNLECVHRGRQRIDVLQCPQKSLIQPVFACGNTQVLDAWGIEHAKGCVVRHLERFVAAAEEKGYAICQDCRHRQAPIGLRFRHGLGDAVYFCYLLELYKRHGQTYWVNSHEHYEPLFAAFDIPLTPALDNVLRHPWRVPSLELGDAFALEENKIGGNINRPPLGTLPGRPDELWRELCAIQLRPRAPEPETMQWLRTLVRPLVVLHTHSPNNTLKNIPDAILRDVYEEFIDGRSGTLLLLDHDGAARAPPPVHDMIYSLRAKGIQPDIISLWTILEQADLAIGIDSGPLHLCRMTNTPAIGIWQPGFYPSQYSLPRREQLNVVVSEDRWKSSPRRFAWNIYQIAELYPERIIGIMRAMLEKPHYLPHGYQAEDVQLRQFVSWCNGHGGEYDRHVSFDLLLREMARFPDPLIIETGTVRMAEDWSGAGYFTVLMGTYLLRAQTGKLLSIDNNESHLATARRLIAGLEERVELVESDSVEYLANYRGTIDVLYLDSLDITVPGFAEHGLREIQAAYEKLHDRSIVVFDDTWRRTRWVGKGAQGVPWLLDRNWKILYHGHQTVLTR